MIVETNSKFCDIIMEKNAHFDKPTVEKIANLANRSQKKNHKFLQMIAQNKLQFFFKRLYKQNWELHLMVGERKLYSSIGHKAISMIFYFPLHSSLNM